MKSPLKIAPSVHVFVFAALASHSAAALAAAADAGLDAITLYSLIVPLVLVLAAAACATVLLRRWRGSFSRRDGPLQLVHIIALGPRERLALVRVGKRYLVVGITPAQITRVAELDDPLDDISAQLAQVSVAPAPGESKGDEIPPG